MNVLVTGGAGYIGSHAVLRLLDDGHAVTIVDDLSRGHRRVVEILAPLGDLDFVEAEVGDRATLAAAMSRRDIDVVMHFAALALVGESVQEPLLYYRRNTAASLGLLEAMDDTGVRRLVFSSTCATYGEPPPEHVPIGETCPQEPINPYGRSKLMVEHMLRDYATRQAERGEDFAYAVLRYFNVAGNDRRLRLGEDHRPETHLVPICIDVALGRRPRVEILGTDYPTPDGTCVRDYMHVEDLIDAHLAVLPCLETGKPLVFNIGVGGGYSVREIIDATRRVTGVDFEEVERPRRPGDPPELYNDPTRLREQLGWSASITDLDEIIDTAWRWRRDHPEGYG